MHKLRFGNDFSRKNVTENFYEFINENKSMFTESQKNVLETILDWLLTSHHGNKVPQSTIDYIYHTVDNILHNLPITRPNNKTSLSLFNRIKSVVGKGINLAGKGINLAGKGIHQLSKGVYHGARSALHHGINGINVIRNTVQLNEVARKTTEVVTRVKNGLNRALRSPFFISLKTYLYDLFNQYYQIMTEPILNEQGAVDNLNFYKNLLKRAKKLLRALENMAFTMLKHYVATQVSVYINVMITHVTLIIYSAERMVTFLFYVTQIDKMLKTARPDETLVERKCREFLNLYIETSRWATGPLYLKLLNYTMVNTFLLFHQMDPNGSWYPVLDEYNRNIHLARNLPPAFSIPLSHPIYGANFGSKSSTTNYPIKSLDKMIRKLDKIEYSE